MTKFDETLISLPRHRAAETLGIVRADLRKDLATGELVDCPCCGGRAKVYARKLTSTQCQVLRIVAASNGVTARQVVRMSGSQGELGKLAMWGFSIYDADARLWHATGRGRAFLVGNLRVPHRVLIYQGDVLGFDASTTVTIADIVDGFDLERDVMTADAVGNADVVTA
jgi:hypothetical protein